MEPKPLLYITLMELHFINGYYILLTELQYITTMELCYIIRKMLS